MYPFITIWWQHIEMTGLGIILAVLTLCITTRIISRKHNLIYTHFFYMLPTFILVTYLIWSYIGFVLTTGHIVPYSMFEIGQIIIPPRYSFHAWWLSIGIIIALFAFLYKLPAKVMKKKWLDVFSFSFGISIIILGFFLLLGDHMYGLPTTSFLGVYALHPMSEMSRFTTVYPIGLFLSTAALISLLITIIVFKQQVISWRGFWFFSVFFFLLSIVLVFQSYPRHGVISIASIRLDINQYILIILSILMALAYTRIYIKEQSLSHQ